LLLAHYFIQFRNNYDNDATTFSPTGRIFQIEYAIEAIKQGSAAVGLVSKTHVVLAALKRNAEELGSYQKKVIKVDDHMGVALAGLAPDARILSNYLRQQAMSSKMVFNRPLSLTKAVNSIADKAQDNTQSAGGRPYGVGLLVAGFDESGPHLFEFLPSGSVLEYTGAAIGARSQAAKTFFERKYEEFPDATKEQLIEYALTALRDTLAQDKELTTSNTTVAVVGADHDFTIYDDDDVEQWLNLLDTLTNARTGANNDDDDDDEDDDAEGDEEKPAAAAVASEGTTTETTTGEEPATVGSESMDIDS
jgi:20S proteasome subunit alpha 6